MSELSLDFSQNGIVKFRTCPYSGGCSRDACETSQKNLPTEEFQTLMRLARDAKLFSCPANGSQIDFSFRWLEVHAGNNISILVTTLNDSFSEPGPRKELLDRLETLDEKMANHDKEKRPR